MDDSCCLAPNKYLGYNFKMKKGNRIFLWEISERTGRPDSVSLWIMTHDSFHGSFFKSGISSEIWSYVYYQAVCDDTSMFVTPAGKTWWVNRKKVWLSSAQYQSYGRNQDSPIHLSIHPSIQSICPSICPSIRPTVHPFVHQSVHPCLLAMDSGWSSFLDYL